MQHKGKRHFYQGVGADIPFDSFFLRVHDKQAVVLLYLFKVATDEIVGYFIMRDFFLLLRYLAPLFIHVNAARSSQF